MVSVISVEEIKKLDVASTRDDYLVIQFCSVEDVPAYDEGYFFDGARQDLFIKSYISKDLSIPGVMGREDFGTGPTANEDYEDHLRITKTVRQIGRMSDYHFTLRKHDEGRAIWNSYHNFKMKQPKDGLLTVELYHASRKQSMQVAERARHHGETPDAAHGMLGTAHIALDALTDAPQKFLFQQANKRFPNFSISLRRVYKDTPPSRIKTFFMIRHGESKWNIAQEHNNVRAMLHRDHSLTKVGTDQAVNFNASWRKYYGTDKSIEEVHANEVENYPSAIVIKHHHQHHQHPPLPVSPTGSKGSVEGSSGKPAQTDAANTTSAPEASKQKNWASLFVPGFLKKKVAPPPAPMHHALQRATSSVAESDVEDTRSRSSSLDLNHDQYQNGDHDHHANGAEKKSSSQVSMPPQNKNKNKSRNRVGSDEGDQADIEAASSDDEGGDEDEDEDKESAAGDDDDDADDAGCGIVNKNGEHELMAIKNVRKILKVSAMLIRRRVEFIQQFMAADAIYVSPLTRAIQTSLFTLYKHPALANGIHIMSTLREYKGPGGLDTVGMVVGKTIKDRVYQETAETVHRDEAEEKTNIPFHVNDAELHWWTDFNHYEGKRAMNDRMCEFLDFAQFCEAETPIFVGHSNFFRYFYSNYLSEVVEYNRPALCQDLRQFRLANACCLAVTVLFEDDDDEPVDVMHATGGVMHGTRGSHHEARTKHVARIIDADIVFTDHRLSFANGNHVASTTSTASKPVTPTQSPQQSLKNTSQDIPPSASASAPAAA